METQQRREQAQAPGVNVARMLAERWRLKRRGRFALSLRWLMTTAGALALTLVGAIVIAQPAESHLGQLALDMAVTGGVSLVVGGVTLWALQFARLGSVRVTLAIPPLLTAGVIAFNVAMLAQLMFITVADSKLLLGFLLFGVAVALALSSTIGNEMSRAIARIEDGARRIAGGAYAFRLDEEETRGGDEIAQLAAWFNAMAGSVQSAFAERQHAEAERRQVITAVSHDLRTPLASVRAMIEAIDDGVVTDPGVVRRYQRTIRAEVGHLSLLMDDLFDFSRLEARTLTLQREWVDLSDLISDMLEAAHEQAEQAGVSVVGQMDGEVGAVWLDPKQLYRVFNNLTQNALRHTAAGGAIMIRVTRQAEGGAEGREHIVAHVIDNGEGIAAADLPHIFEPTYRGEASRRRELAHGAGAGLGLAIAREIVEMHGGRIWAVSPLTEELRELFMPVAKVADGEGAAGGAQGGGAALCFTLPLAAPHAGTSGVEA